MRLFDAVSVLERIDLSGALTSKINMLLKGVAFMQRVDLSKEIAAILAKLGSGIDKAVEPSPDNELSDDPNSPNYRYADTGYIADSRKEKAANTIFIAKKSGSRLRASDVDFDAIEQNPREAADLITKANLFGKTDWVALKDSGMESGAGFLISKIYASIGKEPAESTPLARKDYAIGLETIRDRLENKNTAAEVVEVIDEIRGELNGTMLNSDESGKYETLRERYNAIDAERLQLGGSSDDIYNLSTEAASDFNTIHYNIENRKRRKWAVGQDLIDALELARKRKDDLWSQFAAIRHDVNPKLDLIRKEMQVLSDAMGEIKKSARARNLIENQASRSWLMFGERFLKLVHYRSFKGSDSFAGHVTNAKAGRVKDWSWADKDRPATPKGATKQEINFQLKVADSYERKGGKQVSVNSTQQLKEMLGFSEVQSGNWVLKDQNSAKFHVEQTAAAMSDLGDMLGIDSSLLGFGGRLGMAFGARGTGGKNAARAHYEPIHRVINLTKMGGGGALGHEYLHSLDNILHELVSGQSGAKDQFVTSNPALLPVGKIQDAVMSLRKAMLTGDVVPLEQYAYTQEDVLNAKSAFASYSYGLYGTIKSSGNAKDAVLAVNREQAKYRDTPKSRKNYAKWRKYAVAYYHNADDFDGQDGAIFIKKLPTGSPTSSFSAEAVTLDNGSHGKYWSQTEELAARAFQSYIEDKLASADRKNDYLSAYADNKFHFDPLTGIQYNPFPEGDERKRINAAFEQLFDAIKSEKVFERVNENKVLMDSIFNLSGATSNHALDSVTSLERIGLSGDLTVKVGKLRSGASFIERVDLSKEIAAILAKLGSGAKVAAIDLVFDLEQPEATRKSIAAYLDSGIDALPESLRALEAKAVADLASQVGDGDLSRRSKAMAGEYSKTFEGAFKEIAGRGLVVDIDADALSSKIQAATEITKERYSSDPAWLATQSELVALNANIKTTIANIDVQIGIADTAHKSAVRGGNAGVVDAAESLLQELFAKRNEARDAFHKDFAAGAKKADAQAAAFNIERAQRANAVVRGEGVAIIAAIQAKSPVTPKQAQDWAASQNIEPAALKRLAKSGYRKEQLLQDMADFYQLVGGKSSKVSIVTNGGRRAYTTNVVTSTDEKVIAIDGDFTRTTLFHELAHHLENDPIAQAAANGFLEKRREGTKLHSMRSLTGSKGFNANEVAYKDGFIHPYIGKFYRDNTTEVFSMGVEYLANPLDAARMYAKDPEMFALISGYLGSALTPAMNARLNLHTGKIEEKADLESKVSEAIAEAAGTVTLKPSGWFEDFKAQNEWDTRFAIGRAGGDTDKMKSVGSYLPLSLHVLEGPVRTVGRGRRSKGYILMRDTGGRPDAVFAGRTMLEARAFVAAAIKENGYIFDIKSKYFAGATKETVAAIKSLSAKASE